MPPRSPAFLRLLALAALATLLMLAGCGSPPPGGSGRSTVENGSRPAGEKPLRVGLLVAGSVNDGGWNQLAKDGLDLIARELRAKPSHHLAETALMAQGFKD